MPESVLRLERKCEICESSKGSLLFQQKFSSITGYEFLNGYNIVSCNNCGFCFADSIPNQSGFDRYYHELSKYENLDPFINYMGEGINKFQTIASLITNLLPNTQTRILEIGCSTGILLSLLKQSGYKNVLGVDPSPICSKKAHDFFGIQVSTNTFSDLKLGENSVDVIIMIGVLEHIRDLSTTLKKCYQILSKNGQIFISVPDASKYTLGRDAPFQEFSIEHINFFGPISLSNLFSKHGFSRIFINQIVLSSGKTITPIIHAAYKKVEITNYFSSTIDNNTNNELKHYIDQSQAENNKITKIINEITSTEKSIIVWGVGSNTLRLLATSNLGKANIMAFVDSNPRYHGKIINNIRIIPPKEVRNFTCPILISSRQYQEEIIYEIRTKLKLNNKIISLFMIE